LDEKAAHALKELVLDRGRAFVRDPRACEKLIAGILPADSLECAILRRAARERIPLELLDVRIPLQIQAPRLARRLEKASAVRPDVARWAVDTWAAALGIEAPDTVAGAR
jgi:hypothetical protein